MTTDPWSPSGFFLQKGFSCPQSPPSALEDQSSSELCDTFGGFSGSAVSNLRRLTRLHDSGAVVSVRVLHSIRPIRSEQNSD